MTSISRHEGLENKYACSLVLSFSKPAGKAVCKMPFVRFPELPDCVTVDGELLHVRESPLMVQPDFLVDSKSGLAVGFTFEIFGNSRVLRRCEAMLSELDSQAIRLSESLQALEVFWSRSVSYHEVFGQFDFGAWGFLYPVPSPQLHDQGNIWTTPRGLIVPDTNAFRCDLDLHPGLFVPISVVFEPQ